MEELVEDGRASYAGNDMLWEDRTRWGKAADVSGQQCHSLIQKRRDGRVDPPAAPQAIAVAQVCGQEVGGKSRGEQLDTLLLEQEVLSNTERDDTAGIRDAVVFCSQYRLSPHSRSLNKQLNRSINGPASGPPVALSLSLGPW